MPLYTRSDEPYDSTLDPDPLAPGGLPPMSGGSGVPWWEGPPPKGYTGVWPPPLPPGASYGPNPGQIDYAPGTGPTFTPGQPGGGLPPSQGGYNPQAWGNTPTLTPVTTPTQGGTLASYAGGTGLTAPFMGTFTAPTPNALPNVPTANLPPFPTLPKWNPTDPTSFQSDPQYVFNKGQGLAGVQQSAAARGLLNSGGTLKDIAQWTGDYANNYFNDVDTRRRNDYATDIQTQYIMPWEAAYRSALDALGPQMTGYTTNAAATQRGNELDYSNAWNRFLFGYDVFRDQRDSTFNKAYQLAAS